MSPVQDEEVQVCYTEHWVTPRKDCGVYNTQGHIFTA